MENILRGKVLPLDTNPIDERAMTALHIDHMKCRIFIDDFSMFSRDVDVFKDQIAARKPSHGKWRMRDDSVRSVEAIEYFIWSWRN